MQQVLRVLRQEAFQVQLRDREHLRPIRRADVIIPLGGDGTFLRASHYVEDLPMLGVNSDPAVSVGFFCGATRETFRARLRAWLRGALPRTTLTRLQLTLNGRRMPELILNECLVTHQNPAATSRYLLHIGTRQEAQTSSGLWVATPAGSTAAARSAGGHRLPLASRQFQFVAREPFVRGKQPVCLWRGRVPARGRLEVLSLMPTGMLYLDGPHITYPFRWGDQACFGVARTPLRVLGMAGR